MSKRTQLDKRLAVLVLTLLMIGGAGALIALVTGSTVETSSPGTDATANQQSGESSELAHHAQDMRKAELTQRFQQAVLMLHAKEYDHAMVALHRVLELAPTMPEAHVNMGFAMLALEHFGGAHDFFQSALTLRSDQINGYYGLAVALEGLCDFPAAVGAMKTYVHLAPEDEPFVRKARAALWEWQEKLKSGSESIEEGCKQQQAGSLKRVVRNEAAPTTPPKHDAP